MDDSDGGGDGSEPGGGGGVVHSGEGSGNHVDEYINDGDGYCEESSGYDAGGGDAR